MNDKYFITGATGNVGSQVVEQLLKAGRTVVGAKLPHENPDEKEGLCFLNFDFTEPETWAACMEHVNYVFLMRPPHISKIKRDLEPFMLFMKKTGVKHIVFMSVQGAEHNRMVPHYDVEQICIRLELPYTFIRPSFFMQNLTTTHLEEISIGKQVFTPTGKGKTNFIDVRDIGEIAAKILMDETHIGMAYTVTGERSYSYAEIAENLSEGLNERIRFVNPGALHFVVANLRKGRKLIMTLVMLILYSIVRFGKGDITTDTSEVILGRKARSLEAFIADNRALLKGV